MTGSNINTGSFSAADYSIALVAARFNAFIVEPLIEGAIAAHRKHGGTERQLEIFRVPGAFELPAAAQKLASTHRFAAVVALGCVIRGDTPHFDYVAGECARGLMQAGLDTGVPVIFGVLTTENTEQARVRADVRGMNKGGESMEAALEMAELFRRVG
jgi:6,7-dimethyl-8-ribityllumazine synthase